MVSSENSASLFVEMKWRSNTSDFVAMRIGKTPDCAD
jgi:hypothetical protein